MKASAGVNINLEKLKKEPKIRLPKAMSSGKTRTKGTPPADMNPFDDPEWWDICRDETAFGIKHEGVLGCYECFVMCTSDPKAVEATALLDCLGGAFNQCFVPELTDIWNGLFRPTDSCNWQPIVDDPNSWRSEECLDSIACETECASKCTAEGFGIGICQTSGGVSFCHCE